MTSLSRRARFVVPLVALSLFVAQGFPSSASASESRTPVCKAGQKSTKAHPCIKKVTTIQKPVPVSSLPPQDPGNTGGRVENGDAVTVITVLDQSKGLYQLLIQNTSGIGFINTFNWVPPAGFTVTAVTSSEGGRCTVSNGDISCTGGGKGIAPPA